MLTLLLMFALSGSQAPAGHQCPPPGFEHASYPIAQDAAVLAAEVQRQLDHSYLPRIGPAGLEARPDTVNLDLYIGPDGVASICFISGERHVIAGLSKSLAHVKLHSSGPVIVPLYVNLVWHSENLMAAYGDLTAEFTRYDLKVSAAARP